MQYGLLIVLGAALGLMMRRITLLRRQGLMVMARRLYLRTGWVLIATVWLAMLAQEAMLLLDGRLTWQTGLPLHLCSVMGVLTAPMLLTGSRFLWHASLYLGMPGALLALAFPSIIQSPWPETMRLVFFLMHCAVALAPLLPLSLGDVPAPAGALHALAFLLLLALCALAVNAWTGANYLFLSMPAAGTPLALLAGDDLTLYRLTLLGLCLLVLLLEALCVQWWQLLRRRTRADPR